MNGGKGSAKSLRVYTQTASVKRLNIQENGGATQPMMTFDEIL